MKKIITGLSIALLLVGGFAFVAHSLSEAPVQVADASDPGGGGGR